MSWSIGYDRAWRRWIGYGVPAYCDHPKCRKRINRGLACVCGGEPYGGDEGCGLYFCAEHLAYRVTETAISPQLCPRCIARRPAPYKRIAPEHPDWLRHMLTDDSWAEWRSENPEEVQAMRITLEREDAQEATAA